MEADLCLALWTTKVTVSLLASVLEAKAIVRTFCAFNRLFAGRAPPPLVGAAGRCRYPRLTITNRPPGTDFAEQGEV